MKNIVEILQKAQVCRIALQGLEYPYIIPMNFGFTERAGIILYFHCAREGKKLELIRDNNKACFEVETDVEIVPGDGACGWTTKYKSIMGNGVIDIIDDEEEKRKGLDIIMNHYTGGNEFIFNEESIKKTCVLRLTVNQISAKAHR